MSGHSKWATIHRQKGINDAKRGALFTKIAHMITTAVRQGRGLALALDKAKQYNMPKDNIQRAIDKGSGGGENISLEEVTFEGFLPGGVAVMVVCLTDNRPRATQEVRMILEKNGGKLGSMGSVRYLFDMDPLIEVEVEDVDTRSKIELILEKLEELDDTEKVLTNYA